MLRLGVSVTWMFLTAAHAFADELACHGPFAKDTDHKRLVAAFGRANVIRETVYKPEGLEVRASIVFPKDPVRRLEVLWSDEEALKHPVRIDLVGSGWSGPEGLRIGSPIADVEKVNGKPFVLYGFQWDYGGRIESWNGGRLDKLAGGCRFYPVFDSNANVSEATQMQVANDQQYASNSPQMKAATPKIISLHLLYPKR
jgi:hypothetical protein